MTRRGAGVARCRGRVSHLSSKIGSLEPGVLGDSGKHLRSDLVAIVKGENKIGVTLACHCFVPAGLPKDSPADVLRSGENSPGLR